MNPFFHLFILCMMFMQTENVCWYILLLLFSYFPFSRSFECFHLYVRSLLFRPIGTMHANAFENTSIQYSERQHTQDARRDTIWSHKRARYF